MGLFDQLRKSVAKPLAKMDILGSSLPLDAGNFSQLYAACAGYVHARQLLFGEHAVKQQDWNVDLEKGEITFGTDAYPIQLLGSESDSSDTWLWSWANTQSGLSESVCRDALALRDLGEKTGYRQLCEPEFDFSGIATSRGHAIAGVAAMLSPEHTCYYRCPYQGGAAYVLVKNLPAAIWMPLTPRQVVTAITEVLESLGGELNHKLVVLGIGAAAGLGRMEAGNEITLQFRGASPVVITFDGTGRIAGISATLDK